jgi:DNA-binding NarL/FixJ family response regulator
VAGAAKRGLQVRAGLHTGECDERDGDLGGIAVHLASRVAAKAEPGEVVVSSTVKDLATGSGLSFSPRGSHALKGASRKWQLFALGPEGDGPGPRAAPRKRADAAPAPARVLLVDDHPLWRQTLRGVLHHSRIGTVVGEAADGAEALTLLETAKPDVVVMDIDMPGMGGVEATRLVVQTGGGARVLVLSSSDERSQVLQAVRAGASGYLLKTAGSADITDGVRRVHAGELVFPAALANVVLTQLRGDDAAPGSPSRICVLAGSALDRRGLARLLEDAGFYVGCAAGTTKALIEHLAKNGGDVVAVDVAPADTPGVVADIRAAHPDVGVLVLSRDVESASAVELLSHGSPGIGYLLKDRVSDVNELCDAIRRIADGESVVDPSVADRLVERRGRQPLAELTSRERDVLALMAEGRSNQAIRQRLHVSAKTVEGYVTSIFTKLGLEVAADDHRRVLAVIAYLRSR